MKFENQIKLITIRDVHSFVNIVTSSQIQLEVSSGRYTVDGRSLLGILSLDLLSPINISLEAEEEDATKFLNDISSFLC